MGHGFSPVGSLTGGLAGPTSILEHPNVKNLITGGIFKSDADRKQDGSKGPLPDPNAVVSNTQKNPLTLNTSAINTPDDTNINNSLKT